VTRTRTRHNRCALPAQATAASPGWRTAAVRSGAGHPQTSASRHPESSAARWRRKPGPAILRGVRCPGLKTGVKREAGDNPALPPQR